MKLSEGRFDELVRVAGSRVKPMVMFRAGRPAYLSQRLSGLRDFAEYNILKIKNNLPTTMIDVHPLTRLKKWLSFDRLAIINGHYRSIKEDLAPKTQSERLEVEFLTKEFERYYRKADRLAYWRIFFNVILYATLLVNVLKIIPFLSFLVTFIELGSTVVGSGLAFIVIFLFTVRINMHILRMQSCMMHLTVIYQQNKKRDVKRTLERMSRVI